MKRRFYRRVMYSLIFLILVIIFTSCDKSLVNPAYGHTCRWDNCPYKNVTRNEWDEKVYEQVGERDTDAYHIDILHLKYPQDDYDELESKLFNH